MSERSARAWTDDWLNGWLAALGATVLVDDLCLQWSDDRRSHAAFSLGGDQPIAEALAARFPSIDDLQHLAIANPGTAFPRNVDANHYQTAVKKVRDTARNMNYDFSLSSSVTDLVNDLEVEKARGMPHGRFDTPAPKGQTLWDRLSASRKVLASTPEQLSQQIAASMDGTAGRLKVNGLGFDVRRIEAGDPPNAGKYTDPVVEVLAFYGLSFFPVRGDGQRKAATRGERATNRERVDAFSWASWRDPLDRWAIDALLGHLYAPQSTRHDNARRKTPRYESIGIRHVYDAVEFEPDGKDVTAGHASQRTYP